MTMTRRTWSISSPMWMMMMMMFVWAMMTTSSHAQVFPTCESVLPYSYDSGELLVPPSNTTSTTTNTSNVLLNTIEISHAFTPWIQLDLSQTILAHNVQLHLEGSVNAQTQILDARGLYENNGYSAVFDGESVKLKLVVIHGTSPTTPSASFLLEDEKIMSSPGGTGITIRGSTASSNTSSLKKKSNKKNKKKSNTKIPQPSSPFSPSSSSSRIVVSNIKLGLCNNNDNNDEGDDTTVSTICGSSDDRVRSYDVRQGRMGGCTAWLIGKNVFLRAGHCGSVDESTRLHFTPNLGNAPIADQYAVDISTYKFLNGGVGKDWAIGRLHPNSSTGLLAGVAQSVKCGTTTCGWYKVGNAPSGTSGNTIRITGYGIHATDGRLQKTHVGSLTAIESTSLKYFTDSEGGNSGSPVVHEQTGLAIGIHTHGGCSASGGSNIGTKISGSSTLLGHINTLTKACTQNSDCDDKVVCNGIEICHPEKVCTAGTPVYGNGCPTLKPTLAPTHKPTSKPTFQPTVKPTTAMPSTKNPTSKPTTQNPTLQPTTSQPTTQNPTLQPTVSSLPSTALPTFQPTTIQPTPPS